MSNVKFDYPSDIPDLRGSLRTAIVGVCHAYRAQIVRELREIANKMDAACCRSSSLSDQWRTVCDIIERIEPHV